MENVFKQFNEKFFKDLKGIKVTWYDKEGLYSYVTGFVIIKLDDVGTRDSFNGYSVEIYNKQSGLIVKKFFKFKNHLNFLHKGNQEFFHVWYDTNKLDWYISRPTNTDEMAKLIEDFIYKCM